MAVKNLPSVDIARFVRFSVIGSIAFVLQIVLLIGLVELLSLSPIPASAVSYVVSAICNYLANRTLTFRSQIDHSLAAPRFISMALSGLVLNTVAMNVLIGPAGTPYVAAQIFSSGFVLIWNYWWSARWVYQSKSEAST